MQDLKNGIYVLLVELLNNFEFVNSTSKHILLFQAILSLISHQISLYKKSSLNKRERECLYWTACGKSAEEIADILKIKKTTVNWYKRKILHKLNCRNMAQAVYEGLRYGCLV